MRYANETSEEDAMTRQREKSKSKRKSRPSGVTMTTNRRGQIALRSYGPSAPDLRNVMPGLFAGTLLAGTRPASAPEPAPQTIDDECATCLGVGRIRDGETGELRRCLDCNASTAMPASGKP
jgi:hypothetical protein